MKDIDAIRRENLRLIENEMGGLTEAAKLVDMTPSQFGNLRDGAKDSKTGKPRGMRKETARRIEAGAGKPPGWLDVDHNPKPPLNSIHHAATVDALDDWMNHASPRSKVVIDHLKLLAHKNILGDDDCNLIQQLAQRFHKDKQKP